MNVLHREYRTADGRSVRLPADVARAVVRVRIPWDAPFQEREAAVERGPLGRLRADTTYYVEGTRLLVRMAGTRPVTSVLADAGHGTGTSSLAGGRTTGSDPQALVVAVLGYQQDGWEWVAQQRWLDSASGSTFQALGLVCDSAAAVRAARAGGTLPFMAAGNSVVETTAISPGGSPDVVRVGGVEDDGRSALPGTAQSPTFYSGRAYDIGTKFYNRIAAASGADEYGQGNGTSGSAPQAAGLAALVLRKTREAVGDRGYGSRGGSLVLTRPGRQPRQGPLADGRLTSDELLNVLLHVSEPAISPPGARYAVEGYGWFNTRAADAATRVLLGRTPDPQRPEDDAARTAALAARAAAYATNGCGF